MEPEWYPVPLDAFGSTLAASQRENTVQNKLVPSFSTPSKTTFGQDNAALKPSVTPPKQTPLNSPILEDLPLSVLLHDLKLKAAPAAPTKARAPSRASVPAPISVNHAATRYVRVSNLPTSLLPEQLKDYFMKSSSLGAIREVLCDHLATYAFVVLAFHDVREAASAAEYLRYERGFGTALDTECLTREQLVQSVSMSHRILSESEGQVQIDVLTLTASTSPSAQLIQAALVSSIQSDVVRDVSAFTIEQADHAQLRACCTFFDDRLALAVVVRLQGTDLFGCRFSVSLKTLSIAQSRPNRSALDAEDLTSFVNPFKAPASPVHPPVTSLLVQNMPAIASPRVGRHAVPNDNIVDLEAIELGLDIRTTIMLKNLPNRMTDQRLYEIVSKVTPRAFDFLYLRVDFDTGSSVGYAFVKYDPSSKLPHLLAYWTHSFLTPPDIVRFARARLGTRWDPAQSEKQVYMSYANIQGKASLINKFRNSDVMNKRMAYRPKIFHSSGINVGLPEEFPAPDETGFSMHRIHSSTGAPLYTPPSPYGADYGRVTHIGHFR